MRRTTGGERRKTTPEENKEIVERGSFEAAIEGNMGVLDDVVGENFVLHDPGFPEEIRGRDGLREYFESYRNAFPDLSIPIEHMVAEDDLVTVHYTLRGTHEGPLPELPDLESTGNEIEIVGMEVDRLEDGKLVETWLAYDSLGFMQQLGVTPSDDVAAAK